MRTQCHRCTSHAAKDMSAKLRLSFSYFHLRLIAFIRNGDVEGKVNHSEFNLPPANNAKCFQFVFMYHKAMPVHVMISMYLKLSPRKFTFPLNHQ